MAEVAWRPAQTGEVLCEHARTAPVITQRAVECDECVRTGSSWVHLRRCLTCQQVGCCDSSPQRHATKHWRDSGHRVAASAQPGERWAWCFPDQLLVVPTRAGPAGAR